MGIGIDYFRDMTTPAKEKDQDDPSGESEEVRAWLAPIKGVAKRRALLAFARTGLVNEASRAASRSYRTIWQWRKDPVFAQAWDDAQEMSLPLIEDEYRMRAMDRGEGAVSEKALREILRARLPEVYGKASTYEGLQIPAMNVTVVQPKEGE